MRYESIEREHHIEARPESVYEAITTSDHLRRWWPDEADIQPVPGTSGVVSFGDASNAQAKVVPLTVVEANPPKRFSFRWAYDMGQTAAAGNSLLVTFDLVRSGRGTLLRFIETGFQEMGWDEAVLKGRHHDHASGWDHFLPRLVTYAGGLVSTR
ncbi:SRPBCC domain-containing protein [Kribbella sp. NPDC049227]|uniref:SRPBCC domain-containing protein n=1 Tax=Kribbella sp. NPDC049227 TaxID=3364113 RepID=UPI003718350F